MSSESLPVPRETLSQEGRLLHHAITSLKEELDAVDWYRQRAGYIGQDSVRCQLHVSESIVLRIDEPRAVCTITAGLGGERAASTIAAENA